MLFLLFLYLSLKDPFLQHEEFLLLRFCNCLNIIALYPLKKKKTHTQLQSPVNKCQLSVLAEGLSVVVNERSVQLALFRKILNTRVERCINQKVNGMTFPEFSTASTRGGQLNNLKNKIFSNLSAPSGKTGLE